MKISHKLIVYFTSATVVLIGLCFIFIYGSFAEYRKEEFQQRLKEKTATTLRFLSDVEALDHDLLQELDRFTINNLYQENILLFDEDRRLIYSGIDDTRILFPHKILDELSAETPWLETIQDGFDVVGVYFQFAGRNYYGITKAYDTFGHSKLRYLRNVLVFTFIAIFIITFVLTYWIAIQITRPLNRMALEIGTIKLETPAQVTVPSSNDEISFLAAQFNELLRRLNSAFAFQKHAVHHISHELKTPIAILVSNFERMEREKDPNILHEMLQRQKDDTRNLGHIINALLEISKAESANAPESKESFRVDDLLYDKMEELHVLHPDFVFQVSILDSVKDESALQTTANRRLLESVFTNLMVNCIQYSSEPRASIVLQRTGNTLQIDFVNPGETLTKDEQQYMFNYFFRGRNSIGRGGFGVGLVLINRILQLHGGTIRYTGEHGENRFTILVP